MSHLKSIAKDFGFSRVTELLGQALVDSDSLFAHVRNTGWAIFAVSRGGHGTFRRYQHRRTLHIETGETRGGAKGHAVRLSKLYLFAARGMETLSHTVAASNHSSTVCSI